MKQDMLKSIKTQAISVKLAAVLCQVVGGIKTCKKPMHHVTREYSYYFHIAKKLLIMIIVMDYHVSKKILNGACKP